MQQKSAKYGREISGMDYRDLYEGMQPVEKQMKDCAGQTAKFYKNLLKDVENGDLKDLTRALAVYKDVIENQRAVAGRVEELLNGFDSAAYFSGGEFAEQLLRECEAMGVDARGTAPVFEMFPFRVRIDMENQDLYLNRKKISCMYPKAFAASVKAAKERLEKENFKAEQFAQELGDAYDLALLKSGRREGTDVKLTVLYKLMTPLSRQRKEYDQQSFAYDIARLYESDLQGEVLKDGRMFQFGPSRENPSAIRILDKEGREQFFTTISFSKREG